MRAKMRLWIKQSSSSFWVKIFGKGGGRCTKPSSGASSHQLPFSTKNLRPPPFNTAALSLKTSTTRPHRNWLLKVLHQLAGWDWLFSWLSIDCELDLCLTHPVWTSWSAPSHQELTQALTSDQTGLTNFVSDCKVIFTTARVVSITKVGVYHNQHRDN